MIRMDRDLRGCMQRGQCKDQNPKIQQPWPAVKIQAACRIKEKNIELIRNQLKKLEVKLNKKIRDRPRAIVATRHLLVVDSSVERC